MRRDKVMMTEDDEVATPLSCGLNWGEQEHQNNIPATISLFQLKRKGLAIDITIKKIKNSTWCWDDHEETCHGREVAPARQHHPRVAQEQRD